MSLPRPLAGLVAVAMGATLVLSGTSAAHAAPATSPVGKTSASKPVAAKSATSKAAAQKTAAQERQLAQLRRTVLAELARVDAALVRVTRETAKTAALTPQHRAGLTLAAGSMRADLASLRTRVAAAGTTAELAALRRGVPVSAANRLGQVLRAVAAADAAMTASTAADAALAAAVEAAVAAGRDVSSVQAELDAARAAAAAAGSAVTAAADALVASARTASGRAVGDLRGLTGALKDRTEAVRELAGGLAELPLAAPAPEPAPAPAPEPEPAPAPAPAPEPEPAPAPAP